MLIPVNVRVRELPARSAHVPLSVQVKVTVTAALYQPFVFGARSGVAEIRGGVVSTTVTVKLAVPVLPCASLAVQVTVAVPRAKVEPETGAQVTATVPSTLSVAFALNVTMAPDGPVASFVMLAGALIVGGVLSCTLTVCVAVAMFPELSVAV